eukprot:Lithocolla_globosa_v1_NODE_53_length_7694_cov_9.633984.p7 type:complete len:107 gc:universal NODE_53_length_7694_cov_9.633984:6542-6222(-)
MGGLVSTIVLVAIVKSEISCSHLNKLRRVMARSPRDHTNQAICDSIYDDGGWSLCLFFGYQSSPLCHFERMNESITIKVLARQGKNKSDTQSSNFVLQGRAVILTR